MLALVLLVLFTAFVLITALGDEQPFSAADSQNTTQRNFESVSTTTHEFMPSTIPVDSTAVVENRMVTRGGEDDMQQTITFQSQQAAPAIAREYQAWMAENEYTIADERIGQRAASIKAVNGSRALIVLISHFSSSGLSNVEIFNFAHNRP